jgi:predicted dehydrogenase
MNKYLVDITPVYDTPSNMQSSFVNEIEHFVKCVSEGIPCISPAADGVEVMRIIDALYESAKTGREVRLYEK